MGRGGDYCPLQQAPPPQGEDGRGLVPFEAERKGSPSSQRGRMGGGLFPSRGRGKGDEVSVCGKSSRSPHLLKDSSRSPHLKMNGKSRFIAGNRSKCGLWEDFLRHSVSNPTSNCSGNLPEVRTKGQLGLYIFTEVSEVKMEVKMEVNSLRSWKLKWTIPYRLSASKAIVQHAVLNFQPAKQA